MRAEATAHPNIALVKYWGKRDEKRILPHQSSLSVTLAPLAVTARVAFTRKRGEDAVEINGRRAQGQALARVVELLKHVRAAARAAGLPAPGAAEVVSAGTFPEAAGLASSAAAFAALAVAGRAAAGLKRDVKAESILARQGSGSASRSIQGGFCVWRRGKTADGSDSYARQLFSEAHWPRLRLLVALVSREEKAVKSRDGMRSTVETSPYYPAWVRQAEADVRQATRFVGRRDLDGLGALAERNAWRMHATALAADPPLCYLKPGTLAVLDAVAAARDRGLAAYFTLDAGPNPVLLTDAASEEAVALLAREAGAAEVVRCQPGGDVRLSLID